MMTSGNIQVTIEYWAIIPFNGYVLDSIRYILWVIYRNINVMQKHWSVLVSVCLHFANNTPILTKNILFITQYWHSIVYI